MLVDTRLVDEALHVLHQLVVRIVLVRDPVLERVVVDGSDVPRRRLELCLIQHVLPARSDAVRKEAGRVVGLREAVTHGSEEGWSGVDDAEPERRWCLKKAIVSGGASSGPITT